MKFYISLLLNSFFVFPGCISVEAQDCDPNLLNTQGPYRITSTQVQEFYNSLSQIIDPGRDIVSKPKIFDTVDSLNKKMAFWEDKGCKTIRREKFSYTITLDPTLALKLGLTRTKWENKFEVKVSSTDLANMKDYLDSIHLNN